MREGQADVVETVQQPVLGEVVELERHVEADRRRGDTLVLDVAFELDDFTQYRLVNGLDDIGLTLAHGDAIDRYESTRSGWMPSVTA